VRSEANFQAGAELTNRFGRGTQMLSCRGGDDDDIIVRPRIQNVKVSRVEPDGIVLRSKSGISKVYFTELPKEVQERFHYDAAKGNTYSVEQNANLDALRKQEEEAIRQRQEATVTSSQKPNITPAASEPMAISVIETQSEQSRLELGLRRNRGFQRANDLDC
jgi:hypothetical protein